MNKIGFKNFRRFTDFKPIEYKGLTFLVGRNNSGKSTMVKALLLIINYLKSDSLKTLSFNQNNIEDVNIVTFERALNKSAKHNKEEHIDLLLEINGLRFNLTITGKYDSTEVNVISFSIVDVINGFSYAFKPQENEVTISTISDDIETIQESDNNLLNELEYKKTELTNTLKEFKKKSIQEYIQINYEINQLKKKITEIRKQIKSTLTSGQFKLDSHYSYSTLKDVLQEALMEQSSEYEVQYHDIQKGKKPKKIFEALKSFKDNKFKIEKSILSILNIQRQVENVYLGATLNKQSALFAIRDKHNPLAQAIHEYKQLGIDKDQGSDANKFVQAWIKEKEFEIGDSFDILMHAGEAYEVIINSYGLKIPLADKGMGSIQAMLLIIRLAIIIHKKQTDSKLYTVIIEEPELNLHPALQSKLADIFHYVNKEWNINFIIETHSEYLIRKTQIIVKENDYEYENNNNPFSVIYFDKDLKQWNMNYREDGVFKESFGAGFFDVSSQQAISLIKRKVETNE